MPASVSSAAASVTASGVADTAIPSLRAAARSTLSIPTPTRAMALRSGGAPRTEPVVGVVERDAVSLACRREDAVHARVKSGVVEQRRPRYLRSLGGDQLALTRRQRPPAPRCHRLEDVVHARLPGCLQCSPRLEV